MCVLILSTNFVRDIPHFKKNSARYYHKWGTAVAQCLRCCDTNRKVAGSIPDGVIGIFH